MTNSPITTNNHPAHCPVSLDRLHQISEILSKAAAQSDGGNLGYAMADAVKVIDSAIAAANAKAIVPDELLSAMEEVLRISDRDHEAWHKARNGIASCRDAMLQAGNSPVTPDGWVACSERMPDNGGESWGLYLCWGAYHDGAEPCHIPAWFFIHPTHGWSEWEPLEDDCDPRKVIITHWQPVPEAPQQEVKP